MNNVDRCMKCGMGPAKASGLCMDCLLLLEDEKKLSEKVKYPEMELPHSLYGIGAKTSSTGYDGTSKMSTTLNKPSLKYDFSSTANKYTLNPNVKINSNVINNPKTRASKDATNVSSTAGFAVNKYGLVEMMKSAPRYISADVNKPASLSNVNYASTSTGYRGFISPGKYRGAVISRVSTSGMDYGFTGKTLYGSAVSAAYGSNLSGLYGSNVKGYISSGAKGSSSGSSVGGSKK